MGTVDLNLINLLGVDVGFSRTRPTTGIAWSVAGKQGATKAHTDWDRRRLHIPGNQIFSVIAIDGPLVPEGAPDHLVRRCEQILARGKFQKRCKPGASHFGTGLSLRHAAAETRKQVRGLAHVPSFENALLSDAAIVEAFPNAFLGVMLPDDAFANALTVRGRKFDWMYDQVVQLNIFEQLLVTLEWHSPELLRTLKTERDHEKRAGYVCLLTAACVAAGQSVSVGEAASGWIMLPPNRQWADWAVEALSKNSAAIRPDVFGLVGT